ncbi:sarcosine oxidase subunit gamma [Seohaeicola zhoushanensis]
MTDLTAICALGATEPRRETFGALTLAERPDTALLSVALRRARRSPRRWGWRCPAPAHGRWARAGRLLDRPRPVDGRGAGQGRHRRGCNFLPNLPGCSLTEQTDGWTLFEFSAKSGATVGRLLERLVNLDTASLAPGRATRTAVEHMGVFVIRRAEAELAVWGTRSAAESLWHALSTTARRMETSGWAQQ